MNEQSYIQNLSYQMSFSGFGPVSEAIETMSKSTSVEERGAIFTRPEVVDFVLDLVGYTIDQKLHTKRLLEPSCGDGDFLIAAIRRLLQSWRANSSNTRDAYKQLSNSIVAVELHSLTRERTLEKIVTVLKEEGVNWRQARNLADTWLIQGDFLLLDNLTRGFDYVVGNPPYVRQELIPTALINEYRSR